jgi:hypothetical protein
MSRATKTLETMRDRCGVIKEVDPMEVTGSKASLPKIIDEGLEDEEG